MSKLRDAYPHLWPTPAELSRAGARIRHAYQDYVFHVSPAIMAISFETASYILWVAERTDARTATDFGSGFTSYVLRVAGCVTTSVDDSPEWLGWTERFLDRYQMTDGKVVSFDDYTPGPVDLVVYDFAGGEKRNEQMELAVGQIAPGGVCVLDDAHSSVHQAKMHETAAQFRYDLFGLQDLTKDYFGRYAALMVRP